MTLVEIHRELHLDGVRDRCRATPVQRLADWLGYEHRKGRARRVDRGVYRIGVLNPAERRRIDRSPIRPAGRVAGRQFDGSGASSTRSRPRERASSSARLAWCTSSAAPSACVG